MDHCGSTEGGRVCILPRGRHAAHFDGTTWWDAPGVSIPPPSGRSSKVSNRGRKMLLDARARTEPDEGSVLKPRPWTEERWLAQASDIFEEFLAARTEPFTTPEHLWPLLPDPLPDVDRRILVRLVRSALRAGVIREQGARRLKDTYRTADGSEFAINKLVPIYVVVRGG